MDAYGDQFERKVSNILLSNCGLCGVVKHHAIKTAHPSLGIPVPDPDVIYSRV
jgi:hypothetical protein